MKNERELEVSLIRNKETLKKIILKGKIKENAFSVKRHRILIPLYPIYAYDEEFKIILSKSNNDLILVRGYNQDGTILLISAGYSNIKTYVFEQATK